MCQQKSRCHQTSTPSFLKKRNSFDLTLLYVHAGSMRDTRQDSGTTNDRPGISNSAPTTAQSSLYLDSPAHHRDLQPHPQPLSNTHDTHLYYDDMNGDLHHDFVLFRPPDRSSSLPPDGLFPDLSSFM